MNWGFKIAIVYIGFVALIVSMVIISSRNKSELVAKDYYAQELNYQQRIDAIHNEQQLSSSISFTVLDDRIKLHFSPEEITKDFNGEVVFFRPSDASKDRKLKLSFDAGGNQLISKSLLSKGVYKMCISWSKGPTSYYKE